MADSQKIQIIMQLLLNMEIASQRLESAYNSKNGESFELAKKEILDIQKKISDLLV